MQQAGYYQVFSSIFSPRLRVVFIKVRTLCYVRGIIVETFYYILTLCININFKHFMYFFLIKYAKEKILQICVALFLMIHRNAEIFYYLTIN